MVQRGGLHFLAAVAQHQVAMDRHHQVVVHEHGAVAEALEVLQGAVADVVVARDLLPEVVEAQVSEQDRAEEQRGMEQRPNLSVHRAQVVAVTILKLLREQVWHVPLLMVSLKGFLQVKSLTFTSDN